MKIGILTFHRAFNPGAVLQCYALQETLKNLGHKVEIINYKQPFVEYKNFDPSVFKLLLKKPRTVVGALRRWPINYIRSRKSLKYYRNFRNKYLNCTRVIKYKTSIPQNYDRYIIGSDQVWGLKWTNGIDEIFFGEFVHSANSNVIAYAISSNLESIQVIGKDKLKHYLSNFKTISFRERSIRDKVYQLTGIKGRLDIDPVLLADKSIWDKFTNKIKERSKFIFVCLYRLPANEYNRIIKRIKTFAQTINCFVIDYSISPHDFLTNIKYAQYVISSSFHGIALSIVFEKPLFPIVLNDGYDNRSIDLLKSLGAESALCDRNCDFTINLPNADLNYFDINHRLNILRNNSITYLKNI